MSFLHVAHKSAFAGHLKKIFKSPLLCWYASKFHYAFIQLDTLSSFSTHINYQNVTRNRQIFCCHSPVAGILRNYSDKTNPQTMVRILNVAEKNDAAKNIMEILSRGGYRKVSTNLYLQYPLYQLR